MDPTLKWKEKKKKKKKKKKQRSLPSHSMQFHSAVSNMNQLNGSCRNALKDCDYEEKGNGQYV